MVRQKKEYLEDFSIINFLLKIQFNLNLETNKNHSFTILRLSSTEDFYMCDLFCYEFEIFGTSLFIIAQPRLVG